MTMTPRPADAETMPVKARRLVWLLAAAAVSLSALTTGIAGLSVHWPAVLVLAAGIAVGEALAIDLPFRRAGDARFALGDAALAAGLMLMSGTEVVIAAAMAVVASQIVERAPAGRFAFNVTQYVAGAAAAAGLVALVAAPGFGAPSATLFSVAAAGVLVFAFVNIASVSAVIAATSAAPWAATFTRVAPTALILAVGNAALALVTVLLLNTHPWALPALAVPFGLLYTASRQEVRAQLDRDRSVAYVAFEQRLGKTRNPDDVATILREGAVEILGCNAAVWRHGAWIGEVPPGSQGCPVDQDLAHPLVARGPGLGPAVDGPCAAIGLGGGVLVIWQGDLGVTSRSEAWLDRLSRSGRAHFDRASAASALDAERATLRAVVDGTADGICVTDADGMVRVWNPAMAALAGSASGVALGRPVWQVLGEGPWVTQGVHDVVRDPENQLVWRVSVSEVRDPAQGSLRVAVVHDVSAERRVAKMKDDMLAVVSHELRTPLTPIKANAQLLRRCWDRMAAGDREDLLARIEERSDHLARLVGDILLVGQLSATSRPRQKVTLTQVDLSDVLRETVTTQRVARPTHTITLVAPDVLTGSTDPVRLRQVMENLIDNACKFSPPGSPVEVRLCADDGLAKISIADQGRGIAAEDLDRVFERFERLEDPMVMTTSGAGLGLYIVRELVDALGGSVRIESAVGEGTTLHVALPLVELAARPAVQETADPQRVGNGSSSRVSSSARPSSS